MRYLITVDSADPSTLLSSQQLIELTEQAGVPTLEACARLEAEGTILAGGTTRTGQVILIAETQSDEALNQLLQRLPAWGVLKVAVTPLQGFAQRAEQERQALEHHRAAAQTLHREINAHLGQLRDLAGG